ncbi:hypothetical protein [Actinomadura rubrisoli]|uniref:Uncharacterized protein n=1 Tax=Actinomadura rubrisoli TaxID=2530368 RepID=A0A4R5ARJ6_9ACTN|nr:hypothetical protein [Actinomadura rubrisoli]TDD74845.1 hypothetical protein E1298_32130 [Actinomadura rubrisoli]
MTINSAFTAADLDLIVRALNARADIYARVAGRAVTVPDYEIAARAAHRYRTLANRVCAARNAPRKAARTAQPCTPRFFVEGAADPDGQHG